MEAFEQLLQLGREDRFLEFKTSQPWDDLKAKLTRTVLAMSNLRDGGTILIGVTEQAGTLQVDGITAAHLATYNTDDVLAYFNSFAEPYVKVELHTFSSAGKMLLAIRVFEFDAIPIICQRSRSTVLRAGAVYIRSTRMPETCEVNSQTEMRELIELATDKATRRFIERSRRVGLMLGPGPAATDDQLFEKQLEGL